MYQPLMTIAISVLPHKEKNMYQRIAAIALAFCSLLPLGVAQATSADIDLLPGVTLHLGDRDQRGNYWDGYDWRDQSWWRSHQGAGLAIVALADIIGMADAGEIRDGGIRTIIRAAENTIATKTNITATTMAITMVTIKMAMTK